MVFLPQNTQCISVVKIIAFLELKQKLTFFKGLCYYSKFSIDLNWTFVFIHRCKKVHPRLKVHAS